jgi:hypothetical protein
VAHREHAAHVLARAFHLDRAAVQRDQLLDQRQADAEAALGLGQMILDLGEDLEDPRLHLGRDADAGVVTLISAMPRRRPPTGMVPPEGVYLAALLSRLATTWARRV